MADINQVDGVFGGVEIGLDDQQGVETNFGGTQNDEQQNYNQQAGTNLPVKKGFWSSFKAFCFKEIKVELTPYQQKVEDEINEFLHQEITWEKVHDFLFQEVTFGKKRSV